MKMKLPFPVLIFLIIALGCSRKEKKCEFDLVSFGEVKAPFLRKLESAMDEPCKFRGDFWIDSHYYFLTGTFSKEDDAIQFAFDSIVTAPVKYFDFNITEGDTYTVTFEFVERTAKQRVRLERIFQSATNNEKGNVFQFKVTDGFTYEDELFDVIFFVTKEKAVIGSYASKIADDGIEWIVVPGGDILKDRINYSQKKFGELL